MANLVLLAVHVGGGWDELLIAVVAVGVLWLAVKLAARKPVETDEEESSERTEEADESLPPVAPPSIG